jgi:hypothetical protein
MDKTRLINARLISQASRLIEYTAFCACFFYWFFYSLARTRGVPVLFSGVPVNSSLSGIVVLIILLFNAIFFSRLFLELATGANTFRATLTTRLLRSLLPVSLVLFFIAFVTGGRFDYASYKLQWDLIIEGKNPWGLVEGGMVNAYGYVHNFFAVLYSANSLLPKLFFVLLLVGFCWRSIVTRSTKNRALVLFLSVNPFTVSTIAVYGFIDGVCSLLLGLALLELGCTASVKSFFKSGIFLAFSVLTKFYSIVALPLFLSVSPKQKLFRSITIGYISASFVVLVVSYGLWGDSILEPLLFAKGRDPSFLTVWKYVPHSELRTIIFSVVSVFAIIRACTKQALSVSLRTAAVLSIVFGTYYLGHQQFYLGILVALTVYIVEECRDSGTLLSTPLLLSFSLILGWLVFIQTGFELFDEFKPVGFKNLLPTLSFLNSIILVAAGFFWLSTKSTLRDE